MSIHTKTLLAIRDRVRRARPLDNGSAGSRLLQIDLPGAPEGIMLEFSTSEGNAIDAESWIDPEVMALAGISPDEVEKFQTSRHNSNPKAAKSHSQNPIPQSL